MAKNSDSNNPAVSQQGEAWTNPGTGQHFADSDPVTTRATQLGNVGDGNKAGMQFQDADDMYTMKGFNVIEHGQSAAFNMSERTIVDVSRADRGKES
jgi:hypothetical protein